LGDIRDSTQRPAWAALAEKAHAWGISMRTPRPRQPRHARAQRGAPASAGSPRAWRWPRRARRPSARRRARRTAPAQPRRVAVSAGARSRGQILLLLHTSAATSVMHPTQATISTISAGLPRSARQDAHRARSRGMSSRRGRRSQRLNKHREHSRGRPWEHSPVPETEGGPGSIRLPCRRDRKKEIRRSAGGTMFLA